MKYYAQIEVEIEASSDREAVEIADEIADHLVRYYTFEVTSADAHTVEQ